MIEWVIARLREPTTWIGISGFLTAAGVKIAPEMSDAIVTAGVAIGALLAVVLKEKGRS